MRKIRKNVLLICAIGLIASCSSCKKFNWSPEPWVGDSTNHQLVKYTGETVKCDQPAFDKFTCFDENNIAELKAEIDNINNKKVKKAILLKLSRFYKRQIDAKDQKNNTP